LTRGTVQDGRFTMFRRAKLMLADLPTDADQVTVDKAGGGGKCRRAATGRGELAAGRISGWTN
jgi:hypothetical protein